MQGLTSSPILHPNVAIAGSALEPRLEPFSTADSAFFATSAGVCTSAEVGTCLRHPEQRRPSRSHTTKALAASVQRRQDCGLDVRVCSHIGLSVSDWGIGPTIPSTAIPGAAPAQTGPRCRQRGSNQYVGRVLSTRDICEFFLEVFGVYFFQADFKLGKRTSYFGAESVQAGSCFGWTGLRPTIRDVGGVINPVQRRGLRRSALSVGW